MTASEKQIAANRENAKLGGVKSSEGKSHSKMNALKHGILSNFETDFDHVNFADVFNEFAQQFGVEKPSRRVIVEQLTLTYIRILRCARFETDRLKEALNPPVYKTQAHGMDFNFREETVLEAMNDKAPVNDHTLSQLGNIHLNYERSLFSRFQKLVSILEGGA